MRGSAMFTTVKSRMIISWAPRTRARLMPRRRGVAGAGKGAVDRVAEEVGTTFLPDVVPGVGRLAPAVPAWRSARQPGPGGLSLIRRVPPLVTIRRVPP